MKKRLIKFTLAAVIGYVTVLYAVPAFFPLPDRLTAPIAPGVEFIDRNGQTMRRLLAEDLKIDLPARLDEVPQALVDATLAAEDTRFYSHNGIDYLGVCRALRDAALQGKFVSGASTVSQQLIKITSPPRPRSFGTKVVEVFTARKLEMIWDKDEILMAYLNRLPYGNMLTGCRAAARGYFGKPLADLSIAECAFLAGLPNKPTRFNPYRNFDGARNRQLWILGRMHEEGWISVNEYATAKEEPLRLLPAGGAVFQAPHFVQLILDRKTKPDSGDDPPGSVADRTVKTTLDLRLQQSVESAIEAQLQLLRNSAGKRLSAQAAVVVIENRTGDVLALVGSRDFFQSEGGQINGAWTPRSPGSALKPFTYLLALEKGYTAASILEDLPIEYSTSSGVYEPVNYDRRFRGPVSLRHALANSLNVPAVRTLSDLGPAALHQALTEKLGLTGLDPDPANYGLGLTLGNAEVRLLELTNAYACLARLGVYQPYRLTRPDSSQQGSIDEQTLFDQNACWILADILSDNRARAAQFGLHSPLRLPFRVAAKTGTSTDYRDNWTLGFTPEFTVGVWVGQFDNVPLQNVSGVSGAGPIFHAVMTELHRDSAPPWYPRPSDIVGAEIDPLNGKRVGPELGFRPRHTSFENFRRAFLPPPAEVSDYDSGQLTLLSPSFAEWFGSEANHLRGRASVIASSREIAPEIRIVSPLHGTTAFLDPDLPHGGRRFPLRVEGAAAIDWSSDTLTIQNAAGESWAILEPGRHLVTATDRATGLRVSTEISVESL